MAMEGIITERSGHYSFYTVNFHPKLLSTLPLYAYVMLYVPHSFVKHSSVLLTDFMTGTCGFCPQKDFKWC